MPAPSTAVPREPHGPQRARTRNHRTRTRRLRRRRRCRVAEAAAEAERRALPPGRQLGRAHGLLLRPRQRSALLRRDDRGRAAQPVRPAPRRRALRQLGAHDAHRLVRARLRHGRGHAHRRRREARAQRGVVASRSSSPSSTRRASTAGGGMPIERPARSGRGKPACACAMRWTRASTAAPAGDALRATISTCRESCSAVASSAPSSAALERVEDVQAAGIAAEHLRGHAQPVVRAAPRAGARGASRP